MIKIPEDLDLTRFESLVWIIAMLRSEDGCPWDKKQTHESLKQNLLEETYEVMEALDSKDPKEVNTELGDLLMQIVLHAQLGKEDGEYDIASVIKGINNKLISRHVHVFGDEKASDEIEVLKLWEQQKKKERKGKGSMLEGAPKSMPALAYSQAIQDRAARVGFDWKDADGVLDKVNEELIEVKEAKTPEEKEEEIGDLLFAICNYARHCEIDLEEALRKANSKFYKRFTSMESKSQEIGKNLADMSFDEMNALWDEVKKEGNS